MKFGRRFDNSKIPEWADFYVSYRVLKKLLSPYKFVSQYYLRSKIDNNAVSLHNFSIEDIQKLEYFTKAFEKQIFYDLEKVLAFFNIKLNQIITKWRKLRINLVIYKQRSEALTAEVKNEHSSMLKESFQALIKEIKLLSDYIAVNLEAFQKILKKQKKAVKDFNPKSELKGRFEKHLLETKTYTLRDRLNNYLYSVENDYIDFFHKNRSEGMKELRKIFQGNLISRNETFWFGLFFGFSALLIIAIALLFWDEGLDIDGNELFPKIFPIFRGVGLMIIYVWLLAWNVYVWTSYHVNYKLVFRFNYHYSQLSEILKRAAGFSTVLLVLLLWYLLLEGQKGKLSQSLSFVPKEVIPLFAWIVFIGYLVFPHRKMFNGQGRLYVFRIVKNMLKTPFISVNFPLIWATDQLASFVLPLKDLEYTICFYTTFFFDKTSSYSECYSAKGIGKGVLIAAIPLIVRFFQCLRQAYDAGSFRHESIINSIKYLFSFFVAVLSYLVSLYSQSQIIFSAWILFAAISTVYSYSWDLKKDWGFLVPNARHRFLRNDLSYNDPKLYYLAMAVNLLMRLVWVMSISPDVISRNIRPELFNLIVGFIEIFRRSVWNFLRVEKEHIANVGNFKAVPDMNLPFPNIAYDSNLREEEVFCSDLKSIIENDSSLGKPISTGDHNNHKASIMRKGSFDKGKDTEKKSSFKFIPEGEEYLKLKILSKLTLEPISAMRQRERDIWNHDLRIYRGELPEVTIWMKEIKNFKQVMTDKANRFQVVPNYKELKLFTMKSKVYDEEAQKKTMRKTISNRTFVGMHNPEVYEEDEELQIGSTKKFDGDFSDLGSYKKLSFENSHREPLLNVEMKKMSIDKKPPAKPEEK